ncbi:MAG: hypothetical protein ACFFD1_00025 [Candidatus Thorarchaeota archaeon]
MSKYKYIEIINNGYGGNIGSYINTTTKINDAMSKLQLAYERSIKAER